MGVFVRAVISGFGFSLGAALFKRASRAVGFEEGAGDGDEKRRGNQTGEDESGGSEAEEEGAPDGAPRVS